MTAPDPALVERVARAMWNSEGAPVPWSKLRKNEQADFCQMAEVCVSETLAALRESGRLVEWRPIDDDTPLSEDLLLAIKEPVGWTIECGWAGGKNTCAPASGYSNGWRHGRASHWSPRPATPAPAATEEDDG